MPAPRQLAPTLAPSLAMVALLACEGAATQEQTRALPAATPSDPIANAGARVEAFAAAPNWTDLVELLSAGHEHARLGLGPHVLRYTARLETGPAKFGSASPLPLVAVGQPIHERFILTDQLELRWGAAAGEPLRLYLDQHNDHDFGRALIIIDEQVWTRLDGREWLLAPLETDLWQLWADDAQHAVLDLVELAGPYADIEAVEDIEVGGRAALRVSLRASETHHPERTRTAPTPWRDHATVELGAASIILDRQTGLWLAAQLELSWQFVDESGRPLAGLARFDGRVEIPAQPPLVEAPSNYRPLPERERPELLRERMLDGLAGP